MRIAHDHQGRFGPLPLRLFALTGPLSSGLLLGASFWRPDQGWLAWIALVPLAVVMRWPDYRLEIYTGTYFGGVAFHLLGLDFLRTDGYGLAGTLWVVMAYALAPFFVAALWAARALARRARLPAAVALPASWIAMEFVRLHLTALFFEFGFPFLVLGTTQVHQTQLIQIADLFGVSAISWLVASANGAIADLGAAVVRGAMPLKRLAAPLAFVGIPLISAWGYGTWRLATTVYRPGPTVALMPGVLPKGAGEEIAEQLRGQIEAARKVGDPGGRGPARFPDLIVWGEDAYQSPFIDLDLQPSTSPTQNSDDSDALCLARLTRQLQAAVILGVRRRLPGPEKPRFYNSMVYFTPRHGYTGSYDKLRLGPVLEYQPRIGKMLSALSGQTILHPEVVGSGELEPGSRFPVFALVRDMTGPVRSFACSICYDLWFPEVFRNYFRRHEGAPIPDFFVNASNETMLGDSGSSTYGTGAFANACFRSIECRRSLVRCCGDGTSAVIDSCGRALVLKGGSDETKGIIVASVPLDDRKPLHTNVGESFPLFVTLSVALYLATSLIPQLRRLAG